MNGGTPRSSNFNIVVLHIHWEAMLSMARPTNDCFLHPSEFNGTDVEKLSTFSWVWANAWCLPYTIVI